MMMDSKNIPFLESLGRVLEGIPLWAHRSSFMNQTPGSKITVGVN